MRCHVLRDGTEDLLRAAEQAVADRIASAATPSDTHAIAEGMKAIQPLLARLERRAEQEQIWLAAYVMLAWEDATAALVKLVEH